MTVASVTTRSTVLELLAEGRSRQAVAKALGISKSTVAYPARRLGRPPDERFNRRYDWAEVQRHYDAGHSIRECQAHFGFAKNPWHDAVERGVASARPVAMSIEELLGGPRRRDHVKRRLIAAGLLREECATCGISEWRGARLALELHHVNGSGDDNRLENLALLCPNCHSQTESWGGRNRGRARGIGAEAVPSKG